jgi:outer membrane receptor protein involved in Fe transport
MKISVQRRPQRSGGNPEKRQRRDTGRPARPVYVASLVVSTASLAGAGTALAEGPEPDNRVAALEEIVVTAQKKEEKLSEIPLSITAVSASQIEALGATEFRDIADTIPGLSIIGNGVGQSQVNLRGVTTGGDVAPTVGIYVDDVPYGSSTPFGNFAQLALDVGLFDLNRVEVLRGPQGTLYGASTMGGLIKYVTTMPDTSAYAGAARAGFSSTRSGGISYDAAGAFNAPLVQDVAALRISGFYSHDGGYVDNLALGKDDINQDKVYGGRADLLLKPLDKLSVRLTGFAQNTYRDGSSRSDYDRATQQPIDGPYDQRRLILEPFSEHFYLFSGTVDYDIGLAKLTSITSYQKSVTLSDEDVSPLYVPLLGSIGINLGAVGVHQDAETEKLAQELRLAGSNRYLDWLLGGFFTRESTLLSQTVPAFNVDGTASAFNLLNAYIPSYYKEYAGFVTLTGHITDRLDVSGGIRFAHNTQNEIQIGSGLLIGSLPERDASATVKTYLLNLKYKITDTVMPYLRFATGYRPGGPNLVANDVTGEPLASPTFNADTLHSYEAGLKASTADRRYSIDTAVYWINWSNLQITAERNGVGVVANASNARNKGLEATFTAVPIDPLTISANIGYIDAKLTEDSPDLGGVAGERLPDTPKFTTALSGDYTFPLPRSQLQGFAGATYRYVGERFASFNASGGVPQYRLPSYSALDLRTGVNLQATRVELYVRNVTDQKAQLSALTQTAILGGPAEVIILQPRTIGLSVSTRF